MSTGLIIAIALLLGIIMTGKVKYPKVGLAKLPEWTKIDYRRSWGINLLDSYPWIKRAIISLLQFGVWIIMMIIRLAKSLLIFSFRFGKKMTLPK